MLDFEMERLCDQADLHVSLSSTACWLNDLGNECQEVPLPEHQFCHAKIGI